MKKLLSILIGFITATLIFSCDKMTDNGKLDGQWQLMSIHLKNQPSDSDYAQTISKKEEGIYWRFQLDLLMIHTVGNLNGYTHKTTARFNNNGKQLDITQTYINYFNKDSLLTDPNTRILSPIGIDGNAEKFNIDKLDKKRMILSTPVKQLVFRKF